MRRLIVCCDGTWSTPDQEQDGVPNPTNVVRIFNAIAETGSDGKKQVKYYHPGVGTEGNWLENLAGGSAGTGLGKNIMSAYKWLGDNYRKGDQIFLFGFSRGAFTVRSLAGMIDACGLLRLNRLKPSTAWARVQTAYDDCYRVHKEKRTDAWSNGWSFHTGDADDNGVTIFFLGVWDTVGALGIPDNLSVMNLFDPDRKHSFHDTRLTDRMVHAYHAVAIDEWRASFTPTLWIDVDDRKNVHQVWFPGSHSDVGGGHLQTGLSDGALLRMIEAASEDDVGLAFREDMLEQIHPDHRDVLHDSCRGLFAMLPTHPRSVPLLLETETGPHLHKSVRDRLAHPPITQPAYHPTEVLAAGQSVTRSIYGIEPWNDTSIYLEAGVDYEFKAQGEWLDRSISCGPAGTRDGEFEPAEVAHLAGTLWGKVEGAFKWITSNESADFKFTKRVEKSPWFCLMGAIANSGNPDEDGTVEPPEIIEIGEGCPHTPIRSGYLYCFANDAWNFYENNRGSVSLTVSRLDLSG